VQNAPPPPPQSLPPTSYPAPQTSGWTPGLTYGGFWIRLVARLVDAVILGIPITLVLVGLLVAAGAVGSAASSGNQNAQSATGLVFGGIFIVFYLLILVVTIGYQIYFWGTSGSTPGMRLFRLRVVDAVSGGPIGFSRATIRWLMTLVNTWACYIGWIWVAFDPRKQGWHDKVANTVVVVHS
jgi:uncharacterized RDD family membrane protein YckC